MTAEGIAGGWDSNVNKSIGKYDKNECQSRSEKFQKKLENFEKGTSVENQRNSNQKMTQYLLDMW